MYTPDLGTWCISALLDNGMYKITSFCWSMKRGWLMFCFVHSGSDFRTAVFQGMVLQSVLLTVRYVWLLEYTLPDHKDIICKGTWVVLCDCFVFVPISSFLHLIFIFGSFSQLSKFYLVFLATVVLIYILFWSIARLTLQQAAMSSCLKNFSRANEYSIGLTQKVTWNNVLLSSI